MINREEILKTINLMMYRNRDNKTLVLLGLFYKAYLLDAIAFDKDSRDHANILKVIRLRFTHFRCEDFEYGNKAIDSLRKNLYGLLLNELPDNYVVPLFLKQEPIYDSGLFYHVKDPNLTEYKSLVMLITLMCQAGILKLDMTNPDHKSIYDCLVQIYIGWIRSLKKVPRDIKIYKEATYRKGLDNLFYEDLERNSNKQHAVAYDTAIIAYLFMEIRKRLSPKDSYVGLVDFDYNKIRKGLIEKLIIPNIEIRRVA